MMYDSLIGIKWWATDHHDSLQPHEGHETEVPPNAAKQDIQVQLVVATTWHALGDNPMYHFIVTSKADRR